MHIARLLHIGPYGEGVNSTLRWLVKNCACQSELESIEALAGLRRKS